jgi:hypothetical protein
MQNPSKYIDKRIKVVIYNWDAYDFHEFLNLINVYFNNKFVEKGIKLRVDHPKAFSTPSSALNIIFTSIY